MGNKSCSQPICLSLCHSFLPSATPSSSQCLPDAEWGPLHGLQSLKIHQLQWCGLSKDHSSFSCGTGSSRCCRVDTCSSTVLSVDCRGTSAQTLGTSSYSFSSPLRVISLTFFLTPLWQAASHPFPNAFSSRDHHLGYRGQPCHAMGPLKPHGKGCAQHKAALATHHRDPWSPPAFIWAPAPYTFSISFQFSGLTVFLTHMLQPK